MLLIPPVKKINNGNKKEPNIVLSVFSLPKHVYETNINNTLHTSTNIDILILNSLLNIKARPDTSVAAKELGCKNNVKANASINTPTIKCKYLLILLIAQLLIYFLIEILL
jgi:hypothetical protein